MTNAKRGICVLMTAAVLFATLILPFSAQSPDFSDVLPTHWAYHSIMSVREAGYMNGTDASHFSPDGHMTRAMIVTALARFAGADLSCYDTSAFYDVPANSYFSAASSWAAANEITSGTGNGCFSPDAAVTRQDFSVMLRRTLSAMGSDTSFENNSRLLLCYDYKDASPYARSSLSFALNYGIMNGMEDTSIAPRAYATRAQTACMLASAMNYDSSSHRAVPSIHRVVIRNYDGSYWAEQFVEDGHVLEYHGSAPAKAPDENYRYTFSGLDGYSGEPITSNCAYNAKYTAVERIWHTATFLNFDGTLIGTTRTEDGYKPYYTGDTPYHAASGGYAYRFCGWSPAVPENMTQDMVFTARYTPVKQYTANFYNYDGTLLQSTVYNEGDRVYYVSPVPQKSSDRVYDYAFTGWSPAVPERIYSDFSVTACFYRTLRVVDTRYDVFNDGYITVNNSYFRLSDDLYNRLSSLIYDGSRTVGFYVVDLQTKMTIGYNANRYFQTASTIKLGMALTAFRAVQRGEVSLDDMVTYNEYHYVERSGQIRYSPFGTQYSLGDLLHRMIYESDNVAYYMVQDHVGWWNYNDCMADIGVSNRHYTFDSWGYLTPQELALEWQTIYNYRNECWEGQKLWEELLGAQYNFIKEGLNYKYANVAHKSGFNDHGYHDSAIVCADRPYIMVIMTAPAIDDKQSYLASLARLLDEVETEYTNWLVYNER